MKKTELEKIREMNEAELESKLDDLKKELFNLRFQHAINQLDNPMRLKAVKKEIAVGDGRAAGGFTGQTTALHATEFHSFGH